MKKTLKTFIACLCLGYMGNAQSCLPVIEGQNYVLSSINYDTPVAQDVNKWTKTKPAKREAIIADHNQAVLAGKMKPKWTFDMVYNVAKVDKLDGKDHALMVATINKVDYKSHITCDNDYVYLARKYGFQEAIDPQGNKIGYSLLGVAKFPKKIEVGQVLEPFIDYNWTYPKSQVYQHNVKTGSGQSYAGHGMTRSWVSYVPVDVLETKSTFTIQIQNMNAEVTGTTEFKLGKKAYTAYVVESEIWAMSYTDYSYQSDDSRVNIDKMNDKVSAHWEKKIANKMDRKKLVNEDGYIVSYKTEWYVPELGVVNLILKSQGFITNETRLIELK
ncbi:MAG: hypothetical protein ACPGD5_01415 [Salibacteraceae bacterium]